MTGAAAVTGAALTGAALGWRFEGELGSEDGSDDPVGLVEGGELLGSKDGNDDPEGLVEAVSDGSKEEESEEGGGVDVAIED